MYIFIFQNFRFQISRFLDFRFQKINNSKLKISRFEISRFQDFGIQDFKIADFRFPDFKISDFKISNACVQCMFPLSRAQEQLRAQKQLRGTSAHVCRLRLCMLQKSNLATVLANYRVASRLCVSYCFLSFF